MGDPKTYGRWTAAELREKHRWAPSGPVEVSVGEGEWSEYSETGADFYEAMREALPALLADRDALAARLAAVEEAVAGEVAYCAERVAHYASRGNGGSERIAQYNAAVGSHYDEMGKRLSAALRGGEEEE
mgnify:CR=1 FL=1